MPEKIIATDWILIDSPPEKIWKLISDFNSYNYWWPNFVNLKIIQTKPEITGSILKASPFHNGKYFLVKATGFTEYKEITLEYFQGVYSGKGKWILEKQNGKTKLTYTVNLRIEDPFIKLFAFIVPVSKIHSFIFRKIFKNLENYLKQKTET